MRVTSSAPRQGRRPVALDHRGGEQQPAVLAPDRGTQRLAREHDAGEPHAERPTRGHVAVELGVDDRLGDDAVGAQAVQDRAREAGLRGEVGIGVQRVAVAEQPVPAGPAAAAVGVTMTLSGARSGGAAGRRRPALAAEAALALGEDARACSSTAAGRRGRGPRSRSRRRPRRCPCPRRSAIRGDGAAPCRRSAAAGATSMLLGAVQHLGQVDRDARVLDRAAARIGARSGATTAKVGSTCRSSSVV